ncbi:MAG: F-box protein [Chlamydiia bacterium]|nr:F-box protein [Chlamydiia bacterium]
MWIQEFDLEKALTFPPAVKARVELEARSFLQLTDKKKGRWIQQRLKTLKLQHLLQSHAEDFSPFGKLPPEILENVFSYLPLNGLVSATSVNHRWRAVGARMMEKRVSETEYRTLSWSVLDPPLQASCVKKALQVMRESVSKKMLQDFCTRLFLDKHAPAEVKLSAAGLFPTFCPLWDPQKASVKRKAEIFKDNPLRTGDSVVVEVVHGKKDSHFRFAQITPKRKVFGPETWFEVSISGSHNYFYLPSRLICKLNSL